jgi:hypothetical protein
VLVETPTPPALRNERIGKETAAGVFPPVVSFQLKHLAISTWHLAVDVPTRVAVNAIV